jgi:hypothetical protein
VDPYGNPVLSANTDIRITGTGLDTAVTRTPANGIATFGDALKESSTGTGRILIATATTNSGVSQPSGPFRIVTTLKGCNGQSCVNKALGGTGNTSVNSWSLITTNSGFFGSGVNVLQSTQLVKTDTKSQCGGTGPTLTWISDIADQRVTGSGTNVTSTGRELIVIPKATLKASGVLSRGTPMFNICFGAIWIGGDPQPGEFDGWMGKTSATDNTPKRATRVADPTVVPQGYRFYGIPANCPANGTSANPCIRLRTKQVSDVRTLLGSDAASIMKDGDLAIVVEVTGSWDGGSHPF